MSEISKPTFPSVSWLWQHSEQGSAVICQRVMCPSNERFPGNAHVPAPGTGKNSLPVQEFQERLFQTGTGAEENYKKTSGMKIITKEANSISIFSLAKYRKERRNKCPLFK